MPCSHARSATAPIFFRDDEEQRGKQREKESRTQVGPRGRGSCLPGLAVRPLGQLFPRERNAERAQHRLRSSAAATKTGPDGRRPRRRVACGKGIGRRFVNEIFLTQPRFEHTPEEATSVREIALTRQCPPRETCAESTQQRTGHRFLAKALDRQCAATDAHQPARERELLASAVPSASIPDARRGTVGREVQSFGVRNLSHAARRMQVSRQHRAQSWADWISYTSRDGFNTAAGLANGRGPAMPRTSRSKT